jgi:hypothetical protein
MCWAPKFVQSVWNAKEIPIAENGRATEGVPADDGKVCNTGRVMSFALT